jgi:hypothetical protein
VEIQAQQIRWEDHHTIDINNVQPGINKDELPPATVTFVRGVDAA